MYACYWIRSLMIQIVSWFMCGVKLLLQLVLIYCHLYPRENSMKFKLIYKFYFKKMPCRLQSVGHFCSALNVLPWASYQISKIAGCACAGNAGNVFPRRRFQRKPLISDPGMHHGTCVTHVPWCMSGSLTCGYGENVPGIPGACAPAILRIWQEAHWTTSSSSLHNEILIKINRGFMLLLLLNSLCFNSSPPIYVSELGEHWFR